MFSSVRQSLSLKLSLSILLMAVTIFVVSLGVLYHQSLNNVKREAMERATMVLTTTVERVNQYLSTVETATNANDWMVKENLHPDSLLTYSRRIVLLNANVSGCSITTEPDLFPECGRYFSAYTVRQGDTIITEREAPYEYFDKEWYKVPKDLGKACWIDPFEDINDGTLSASGMISRYCKPLYADDGRFIGVISTDLSLIQLANVIEQERPYPHSYFIMLGKEGNYFVHPDSTKLDNKTIFSGIDPRKHSDIVALGHEMTEGRQGSMRVIVDGAPCLVCYQPVPGTTCSLALICPDSDIMKSYHRLTFIIAPLLIVGLLLILLFCRMAVSHAIAPLNQLLRQSQLISEGHYDQQIMPSKRTDVVGLLQNSFASMQESLKQHIGEIQRVNEETTKRNEELVEARQRAEEASKQKTAFIQNITHQIRTPLNIVMGFSQVLGDSPDMPEDEFRSIATMMHHNTVTLNRMAAMLYDSSVIVKQKLERGDDERCIFDERNDDVSCNGIMRESIEDVERQFPEIGHVDFQTSVPDALTIRINHLYLFRVLRELFYNSAKFSDRKNIRASVVETPTTVRFVLEDKGPGINMEDLDGLYTPFVKTNDMSEGLGLGLPLTKHHCEAFGGSLILDADYRDGCRFIVELPLK